MINVQSALFVSLLKKAVSAFSEPVQSSLPLTVLFTLLLHLS